MAATYLWVYSFVLLVSATMVLVAFGQLAASDLLNRTEIKNRYKYYFTYIMLKKKYTRKHYKYEVKYNGIFITLSIL